MSSQIWCFIWLAIFAVLIKYNGFMMLLHILFQTQYLTR